MNLVKIGSYLEFVDAFHPWLEMRDIIRGLGEQPKAEIRGAPLIIDLKDKRERAVLHVRAIELTFEQLASVDDGVAAIKQKLQALNEASTLPGGNLIRLDSIFIEPYAMPFHELLELMKGRFLSSNTLTDPSTDIGLMLDEQDGPILRHIQVGPMAKQQLLTQFLAFTRDDIPETFGFLALRYEHRMEFDVASADAQSFFETAANWTVNEARSVFRYLKEGAA